MLIFSEQKRLAKQAKLAEEREKKQMELKMANANVAKKIVDPSDPQEYFNMRVNMIETRRKNGENPFPHKFHVSISLTDFINKYDSVINENGKILEDITVSVAGTII